MCGGGSSDASSVPTGNQHDIVVSYQLVSEASFESLAKEEKIQSYFSGDVVCCRTDRKKLRRVSKRNSCWCRTVFRLQKLRSEITTAVAGFMSRGIADLANYKSLARCHSSSICASVACFRVSPRTCNAFSILSNRSENFRIVPFKQVSGSA